ncbi:hypothetical protein GCM10017687_30200 [Streptomyces echinatus]
MARLDLFTFAPGSSLTSSHGSRRQDSGDEVSDCARILSRGHVLLSGQVLDEVGPGGGEQGVSVKALSVRPGDLLSTLWEETVPPLVVLRLVRAAAARFPPGPARDAGCRV